MEPSQFWRDNMVLFTNKVDPKFMWNLWERNKTVTRHQRAECEVKETAFLKMQELMKTLQFKGDNAIKPFLNAFQESPEGQEQYERLKSQIEWGNLDIILYPSMDAVGAANIVQAQQDEADIMDLK
jgi:hypothetical protein